MGNEKNHDVDSNRPDAHIAHMIDRKSFQGCSRHSE